jgi:hypothetical protein
MAIPAPRPALLMALLLTACGSSPPGAGTGLHLSATWSGVELDQLGFRVITADGNDVHPTERRPAVAGAPLQSGADVVILLPDDLGGAQVRCAVDGFRGGLLVRSGGSEVSLSRGQMVAISVVLDGVADAGPGQDASAPDAGPRHDARPAPDASQRDLGPDQAGDASPDAARDNGRACLLGTECGSGNCVDGVCCASAACGACFACNVTGSLGSCHPLALGTPEPHGLCPVQPVTGCGLDGTCDGSGACRSYPDGTSCRMGRSCHNGVCR